MRVLLEMKRQISWQEQDLNIVHRTWTSLRHLGCSCQESGQELDEQKSQKNNGNPQLDSNRQRDLYQDPLPE
jgi:hypothetical protein